MGVLDLPAARQTIANREDVETLGPGPVRYQRCVILQADVHVSRKVFAPALVARGEEEWIGEPPESTLDGVALFAVQVAVRCTGSLVEQKREIGPLTALLIGHPTQCLIESRFRCDEIPGEMG